jgi:phthalate 4,5-dioxygenase
MLTHEQNQRLTQTNAGTPMGNLFRAYWIPVLLSRELSEPDGAPVRVRVLGEDLLAFRDTEGLVGLISPRCPHRGADLYFGRNEAQGIRCAYHGWKFDRHGQCVEMPTNDLATYCRIKDRARITSYATKEWGDMIWAYMGTDEPPALPHMEFALVPPSHRFVSKKLQECNWAQAAEGGIDTAHFSFLHQPVSSTGADWINQSARATRGYSPQTMNHQHLQWMRDDPQPKYEVIKHAAGLVLGGSRKANDGQRYWRVAQYLMPAHGYTPSATLGQNFLGQTWIPIDDHSCWIYVYAWNPDRPLDSAEIAQYESGGAVFSEIDENFKPLRHRGNEYLMDRQRQKNENFTGIVGVSEQDAAIQDSQGSIADRTREMLSSTDLGVVRFRHLMLEAVEHLAHGKSPLGRNDPVAYSVRAGAQVAPESLGLSDVMNLRFGHPLGQVNSSNSC